MLAPTRSQFDMTVVWNGSRWRIIVRGELDLRSGDELADVAGVLAAAEVVDLDIDLADVSFIDTAGWAAVATARHRIEATGGTTAVATVSPAVTRYLDLAAVSCSRPASGRPRRGCQRSDRSGPTPT